MKMAFKFSVAFLYEPVSQNQSSCVGVLSTVAIQLKRLKFYEEHSAFSYEQCLQQQRDMNDYGQLWPAAALDRKLFSHNVPPLISPQNPPLDSDSSCSPPLCAWAQLRFPPAGAGARGRHPHPAAASELASHIDGSTAREKSFPWGGGRGADVRRLAIETYMRSIICKQPLLP